MKQTKLSIVGIVLLTLFILLSPAAILAQDKETDASATEIAKSLSRQLGELASLSFSFNQKTEGQISGRTKQASGNAYFVKRGESTKMRWNYLTPDRQVIISDGEQVTMYFASLNQMIIAPADQLQQDVTYTFFTGQSNIDEKFIITQDIVEQDLGETVLDHEVIKLIPRTPSSQIQYVRLWVADRSHIRKIEIVDNFETITTILLSNIEENSLTEDGELINRQLFSFTPPEGTEIIRQ